MKDVGKEGDHMEYTSTRDSGKRVSSAQAILTGLSPDGGLFVPVSVPRLDIEALHGSSYQEVAFAVLHAFLPDYDEDFLRDAIARSYGENFDGKAGYLAKVNDSLYALELWHGPTAAFKDYALQLLPKLLVEARRMLGETGETVILVATSGDTGSAALAGFSDIDGTKIAAFYPQGGTSVLQRLQMTTQTGKNMAVYGVSGNFDDAQRGVKAAFVDKELARELAKQSKKLSSANSINWGRLVPQVVYYATSYLQLCAEGALTFGQPLDFCVPTGNFGDIMAGWYAKQMGVPVGRLLCASNKNNVLSDFLQTGRYDAKRTFYKTSSPSMDILVSSNLERLLWHTSGSEAAVRGWMDELAQNGEYTIPQKDLDAIKETFAAGWVDEDAVFAEIKTVFERDRYLSDPHTAVAFKVLADNPQKQGPAVVVSTASPYKFGGQVLAALGQPVPKDEFESLRALQAYSGQKAPASLASLADKQERFTDVIDPSRISEVPLGL